MITLNIFLASTCHAVFLAFIVPESTRTTSRLKASQINIDPRVLQQLITDSVYIDVAVFHCHYIYEQSSYVLDEKLQWDPNGAIPVHVTTRNVQQETISPKPKARDEIPS